MSHIRCILSCNNTIRKLYVSLCIAKQFARDIPSPWNHIDQNLNDWIKCYNFAYLHWAPYFAVCLIMYLVKLVAICDRWAKNTSCKIDYYRFINGASYNMAKSITRYRCNRYMDALEQIKIFQQMHLITERLNKILII